jgi:hypothetical protein
MITVYAKNDCGCCSTEMKFKDEESAARAFNEVGFGNGMTVTDDEGIAHDGIDTFYGFTVGEENKRGLGYLFGIGVEIGK